MVVVGGGGGCKWSKNVRLLLHAPPLGPIACTQAARSLHAGWSGRLSFSYESKKRKETKPLTFEAINSLFTCWLSVLSDKLLSSYRDIVLK